MVPFAGLLLGLKHKKFSGFVDYNCKRSLTKPVDKNAVPEAQPLTAPTTTTDSPTPVFKTHELKVLFDTRCCDNLLVFGEATTDLSHLKTVVLGGEVDVGNDTKLKAKVINFINLKGYRQKRFDSLINA
jgi:hypothetical protein